MGIGILAGVRRRSALVAAAVLLATGLSAPAASAAPATTGYRPSQGSQVSLRVIAFNDLHGNLQPPSGSSGRVVVSVDDKGTATTVDAGGAAYLATHIKQLKKQVTNSLVVSAGDNIGASPLASALFHDEPTIDVLNAIGVQASAVGNHEFDEGYQELLRMQSGGCHPTDGCVYEPTFSGARFPILGSNVTLTNGGRALLPFSIKWVQGIPVGIIGVTLHDLPSVVTPTAVAGLKFGDEVAAINRTSGWLDRLGITAQIVLMHQGDDTQANSTPNSCNLKSGVALQIARTASPEVDAFFTGHSHQQYNCVVTDPAGQPRPLIQGSSFGRLLSVVDLKIDRRTRDVVRSATKASNEVVTRDVTPDPAVQAIVTKAVTESAPIGNRPVGTITADLVTAAAPSGEEPLGDVIADAQLAATATSNGAQIAITNPGGIRGSLSYLSSPAGEGNGVVTYAEAFTVQPFANIMQTITVTGAQLDAVLEQQWTQTGGVETARILQISSTLHYVQHPSAAIGSRVSDITVAGVPVTPTGSYRVSVNNFLAAGGDGFTVFAQGTNLAGGPIDLDAFTAYLTAHPNLSPPPADRITVAP